MKFHRTKLPSNGRRYLDYDNYNLTSPYTGDDYIDIPTSMLNWEVEVSGYSTNTQGGDKVVCTVLSGPLAGWAVFIPGGDFIAALKNGTFDASTNNMSFRGKMKKHGQHWSLKPEPAVERKVSTAWYVAQCAELSGLLKLIPENDVVLRPGVESRLTGLKLRLGNLRK